MNFSDTAAVCFPAQNFFDSFEVRLFYLYDLYGLFQGFTSSRLLTADTSILNFNAREKKKTNGILLHAMDISTAFTGSPVTSVLKSCDTPLRSRGTYIFTGFRRRKVRNGSRKELLITCTLRILFLSMVIMFYIFASSKQI